MNTSTKLALVALLLSSPAFGQSTASKSTIDLSKLVSFDGWAVFNRTVKSVSSPGSANGVYLDEKPGQGVAWLPSLKLKAGTIDVDVKGRDVRGKSFVGLAFGGQDVEHFEAIYLRPFNFQAETLEARSRAIQYVAVPTHEWRRLRNEHPGKYESAVGKVDASEWVHLRLQFDQKTARVFIDNSKAPALTVERIPKTEKGWVGLWVGNNSDGTFANLRIEKK